MSNDDILKEVAVETTKQVAKDVYTDAVQPAAKNVGGILGTITGFFNHVVLYPLRKLDILFVHKAEAFEKNMEKRYNTIPEAQRVEPQLHIVGPAMESLKYNILEDDLAEMYSNLLVSDMDSRTQSYCSPSFIKIIEQMTPIEARVFKDLCKKIPKEGIGICEISIKTKDGKRQYTTDFPSFFTLYSYEGCNEKEICRIMLSLQRLGLVELSYVRWLLGNVYDPIKESKLVQDQFQALEKIEDKKIAIDSKGVIRLTEFSKAFAKVCLRV